MVSEGFGRGVGVSMRGDESIRSLWRERVQALPCAAYVVYDDTDCTLLAANDAFYALFGFSEDVVLSGHGGRLRALLGADAPSMPAGQDVGASRFCLKQRVSHDGVAALVHTEVIPVTSAAGRLFFCISLEGALYDQGRSQAGDDEGLLQLAAGQVGLDCFEYDLQTGAARIWAAHTVLPGSIGGADGLCPDFVDTLIASKVVCSEYAAVFQEAFRSISDDGRQTACELCMQREGGDTLWARLLLTVRQGGAAPGRYAVGTLEDITRQKEATRNYLNETQFYQAMLAEKAAYAEVDVTLDLVTRIGGMWNLYNEIIGRVSYSILASTFIHKVVHPEDRKHYLELIQRENFIQSFNNGVDRLGCEFRRIVDQNKMMWMQLSVHLFRDPLTQHVLALLTLKNIDTKKKQELSLLRDSRLDQLTNTFNKKAAEAQIREHLAEAMPEELCAFVILDLDDFKQVNDTRGHSGGDQVLARLGEILGRTFRRNDILGRFGGDEFILFLKSAGSKKDVDERLKTLYRHLREDQRVGLISCSAGVALSRGKAPYEELFQRADRALYKAKAAGKDCYRFAREEKAGTPATSPEDTSCVLVAQPEGETGTPPAFLEKKMKPLAGKPTSFDGLVGEQGDIAYLVDPDTFDLVCGNKAFYDRLGMSEGQCFGVKCYEAMHKRESPCPFCSRANWSTEKFYLWRDLNTALEQEFLIKNKLVSWQGREVLLALAIDLSNNKSIVDSLDSAASEVHSILSGVQHMAQASSLATTMDSALEAIGSFFRADVVRFWQRGPGGMYDCAYSWTHKGKTEKNYGVREVNFWLTGRKWDQPVVLENPEAMLCYSYDMYRYMKNNGIRNQRWLQVCDRDGELGCISIDNISGNFLNSAFLESFSVFIAGEIRKRRLMEDALYAERHDALTGLLSHRSFEGYLETCPPEGITSLGVVAAGFKNLKRLNSAHGFQTGNYFIKQFADMLRDVFAGHAIFRLTDDEFLVVARDLTREDLDSKVAALENLVLDNGAFKVCLGGAWGDEERDLAVLVEKAVRAMNADKKNRHTVIAVSQGAERRRMLSDLVASLDNREYEIFLQAKMDLQHGTMAGAEALIRYRDKSMKIVPPARFLSRLEKNNLIHYVDLFAFREVCSILDRWKRQGCTVPRVSINFSRLTLLERTLLTSMEEILSHYDVSKKSLEIEINESVANMAKGAIYRTACALHGAGFVVSLDGFGSKSTSLTTLADLNVSMLKVDKSLVAKLGSRESHMLIMKNIIQMCAELDIDVVVEGIETKKQEHILRELNCRVGQGYLYGKPMPVDEFERKYIRRLQMPEA